MKREKKEEIIASLTEQIKSYKHLYVSDISAMDAAATQNLRRDCFNAGIKLIQVKNTLLKVALENLEIDYKDIYGSLKGSSAVMLCETGNAPAKVIKKMRQSMDKPLLKAAYVEECTYVGDDQLDVLCGIKSKDELLGDIILLLQSPIRNILSALEAAKEKEGEAVSEAVEA